jgi:hypothetical protein
VSSANSFAMSLIVFAGIPQGQPSRSHIILLPFQSVDTNKEIAD